MVLKTISISEDMAKDIENNILLDNFSKWVEEKYWEEFSPEYQIKKLEEKINKLKNLILNNTKEEINLNKDEIWFLKNELPRRLQRGAKWKGILTYFNNTYNRDFNLKQFKKLYLLHKGSQALLEDTEKTQEQDL